MDRLKALGRGTQIMFIAAVLLLIDSFFRWQEITVSVLGVDASGGVSAWDDFLGIVMGILTIVLIARIAARLGDVDVPIPVSFATTSLVLGVLIAVCAVLKNLTDDYSTFMSYVGVVLAIAVAVGAWMEVQEAGGVEHLKSQMPSSSGAESASAAAGEAPTSAPAAEAASATPAAAAPEPPAPPATGGGAMGSAAETGSDAPSAASEAADDDAPDLTDGPSTGSGA